MNQNSIHEKIKTRSKSEDPCCRPVQKLLSSTLLPKCLTVKLRRTTILQLFDTTVKVGLSHGRTNVV
jgi:hypothetical protein